MNKLLKIAHKAICAVKYIATTCIILTILYLCYINYNVDCIEQVQDTNLEAVKLIKQCLAALILCWIIKDMTRV